MVPEQKIMIFKYRYHAHYLTESSKMSLKPMYSLGK